MLDNLLDEIRAEVADKETISARVRAWKARMSGYLNISFCVCCGIFLNGEEINIFDSLESFGSVDHSRRRTGTAQASFYDLGPCRRIRRVRHAPSFRRLETELDRRIL